MRGTSLQLQGLATHMRFSAQISRKLKVGHYQSSSRWVFPSAVVIIYVCFHSTIAFPVAHGRGHLLKKEQHLASRKQMWPKRLLQLQVWFWFYLVLQGQHNGIDLRALALFLETLLKAGQWGQNIPRGAFINSTVHACLCSCE